MPASKHDAAAAARLRSVEHPLQSLPIVGDSVGLSLWSGFDRNVLGRPSTLRVAATARLGTPLTVHAFAPCSHSP